MEVNICDNENIFGADFSELKKLYGQSDDSVSLCHLLQQLQDMDLEEYPTGS